MTSAGAAPTTAPSSSRVAQSPQVGNKTKSYARSAPASRNGSINKGSSKKEEFIPAPLVPALLAPVPPPPSKRKGAVDVETGEGVGEVLEDAPDKTIMEMLQTYLKKQDLYTRIVLVVLLLVLAGGAMGAYVVMLWYAISGQNIKYIVLVSVFSVVLFWVLWKVREDSCIFFFLQMKAVYYTVLSAFEQRYQCYMYLWKNNTSHQTSCVLPAAQPVHVLQTGRSRASRVKSIVSLSIASSFVPSGSLFSRSRQNIFTRCEADKTKKTKNPVASAPKSECVCAHSA